MNKRFFVLMLMVMTSVCVQQAVAEKVSHKEYASMAIKECNECHKGEGVALNHDADWTRGHRLLAGKGGANCIECHDQSYGEMVVRWKATSEDMLKKLDPKLAQVREEIDRMDRRGGHTFVYRKLYGEAEFNYNLAKNGKGAHNLEYAEELLKFANRRLDEAIEQIARRKQDIAQGKM